MHAQITAKNVWFRCLRQSVQATRCNLVNNCIHTVGGCVCMWYHKNTLWHLN